MSRLRIALVCGHFDRLRDGVADYTRLLAQHLRSTGVDPVICTAHRYAATAEGVVGVTNRWDVRGVVRAAHQIAKLQVDLVHVQFAPSAFGFSRAVGLLPAVVPVPMPVLTTLHEYGVWNADGVGGWLRSAAWAAVEHRGYADRETLLLTVHADRLLVTAADHSRVFSARFPNGRRVPFCVPIGPNIPVAPLAPSAGAVRRRLGLPPDVRVAVFFGFLHPDKGLERLIEAVARVRRRGLDVRLVLAGGGESHSVTSRAAAALRRELVDVARRHNVEHQITFTGYLPEADVSGLLQSADAAVFPFNAGVTDKSGSLLAALAHGVPTIATSAAGVVTRPTPLHGVLRVAPRDTAGLAAALFMVLTDRALAQGLADAGRSWAAQRTWGGIAAAHAQIYAEVLQTGPRPRRVVLEGGYRARGRKAATNRSMV